MSLIENKFKINATLEQAFDLSRSIDFHMFSQSDHKEVAINGITSGLINLGEEVTWRAKHFGVSQLLTARITMFDRPNHFRDTMVRGAFKWFEHDHYFQTSGDKILVIDRFEYESPYSIFGKIFDVIALKRHMQDFFWNRNMLLKEVLEDGRWKEFIKS
ncbi:MAG: SRPBCC family protein [Candidatus Neomarinimicrobiota bacterium]